MKKWIKRIVLALAVVLLLLQFVPRPEKNISSAKTGNELESLHAVPVEVNSILKKSCYDCHSNNTGYPWYANIQPLAFWLNEHITDGKKHFNADEFGTYPLRRQYHALEEIIEVVESGEMPLKSYTLVHTDASLSTADRKLLTNWASALIESYKQRFPADSLLRRKR